MYIPACLSEYTSRKHTLILAKLSCCCDFRLNLKIVGKWQHIFTNKIYMPRSWRQRLFLLLLLQKWEEKWREKFEKMPMNLKAKTKTKKRKVLFKNHLWGDRNKNTTNSLSYVLCVDCRARVCVCIAICFTKFATVNTHHTFINSIWTLSNWIDRR